MPSALRHRKLRAGALDQVVEVGLGFLQGGAVGIFAFAADEEVGIESGLEGEHLDVELFFDQQAQCAFGGFGSGGVGVEIDDDILAETSEQLACSSVKAVPELAITL